MLNPVVVLQQDRRVPSANLIGQDLSGAHVVIFIKVNREARRLGMEEERECGDQPDGA
jgi:hypothetical protein